MSRLITKLREMLFSSDRSLEERMFLLGSIVAFGAMFALLVISAATNQGVPILVALTVMLLVLVLMFLWVLRTHKTQAAGVVLALFIACAIFPAGYLLGGGAYSGSPVWFVIAVAFMAVVLRSEYFWSYFVIISISFAISTYVGYRFPDVVVPLQGDHYIYFDTFFATMIVGLLVAVLLRYTGRIYNKESDLANQQKEEIKALSDAQSRFFSSMSHEIRTPLNTILGLNEMTLRDQQISEEVADNATNIQNAGRMLLSLINDVLDMSKIESGRMELSEVQYETNRLLSDVVNMLWSRAKEKNLNFEVNVGESVPSMLFGDEMRLKQVVINILGNAIKYTDEGTVTLTVDGEKRGANEFMLRVEVDDTGIGIRKEAIPYLFDSFKRVDIERNRSVEGTGLGLAISKQLIDLMNGTITVDSIYTKGSHFQIEVPQGIVDGSPMKYTPIASKEGTAGVYENIFEAPEAHVLIVDDNDMNRMVSRKLLRGTRVQTDVASSGAECLEKTAATRYDVIFMDHEMPEMDGIETLQRLRSQEGGLCRSTPVVALTANAGSDMNAFYLNQGFRAYLAKPIHGSLLEATLLQLLPPELIESTAQTTEGEVVHIGASMRKRHVAITVDSPCGLPDAMLQEHGITRMPFYIVTDSGRFRDVDEIDSSNLFTYFENGGEADAMPASVDEYELFFGDVLDRAETVIHLSVTSDLSDAYDIASQAAASFSNVHVVDSHHLASGLGLMALKAAELAESGAGTDQIIAELDDYCARIISTLLVPSLDSPIMKRVVSTPMRAFLSAFSWEPVLRISRNGVRMERVHGGYVSQAPEKYIRSELRRARRAAQGDRLFVVFAGCTLQEQEEIQAEAEAQTTFKEVIMQKASATVAARVWLHSFGLTYVRK